MRDVSFSVRAGEIVGIAGVDGNGQSELIDAIAGLRKSESGSVRIAGRALEHASAREMLDAGLGHIPEDRQRRGLVLEFSIAENIALHDYAEPPDAKWGWLFPHKLIERARRLIREFDVRGGGPLTRAGTLSGGNQQKVVAAREIARDPKVLIAAQPTRGLDVGAIEFLHRRLVEERGRGARSCSSRSSSTRSSRCRTAFSCCTRGRSSASTAPTSPRRRSVSRCSAAEAGSVTVGPEPDPVPETPEEAAATGTLASRIALRQRSGGVIVPVLTALVAFLIGGLIVLATGHNPLLAYRDIFNGAGLNWIFHPTTSMVSNASYNLSQTLLQTTTLILTGLAVAFAFRCGMFNIGGQGQYFVGLYVGNWIGVSLPHLATLPHVLLGIGGAIVAGAVWAGIAGMLKAYVGAHEVITTIMLNWIAVWIGTYFFGDGGPLQNSANATVPISNDVAQSAKLPVFWGSQALQGLDVGFFVALGGARRLLGAPQPDDARL